MWTYQQSTGDLRDDANQLVERGYAGNGPEKNDPNSQCVKDKGPLPRGLYTILGPVTPPNHLGPMALPLDPDAGNDMCGRGDFLIHGERRQGPPGNASDGCIILGPATRQNIHLSGDNRLQVVA